MPTLSFGYTQLDAKHQDVRFDVALAAGHQQGLHEPQGRAARAWARSDAAPFDLSIALPVAHLAHVLDWPRPTPWPPRRLPAPALTDLNDSFAKLGPVMQKAAIPPFGDLLGLRIALDSLVARAEFGLPTFSGRLVLGTSNPVGLLAMGQMMVPALAQLKPANDGKPVALPKDMASMLGQPAWLAMGDKALALGVGAGEDAKLAATLKDPAGDAGQMIRMHLTGAMYLDWLQLMEQKVDSLAAAAAAISKGDEPSIDGVDGDDGSTQAAADAARSKAQFAAMKSQAERVRQHRCRNARGRRNGAVITSRTVLK